MMGDDLTRYNTPEFQDWYRRCVVVPDSDLTLQCLSDSMLTYLARVTGSSLALELLDADNQNSEEFDELLEELRQAREDLDYVEDEIQDLENRRSELKSEIQYLESEIELISPWARTPS